MFDISNVNLSYLDPISGSFILQILSVIGLVVVSFFNKIKFYISSFLKKYLRINLMVSNKKRFLIFSFISISALGVFYFYLL